MSSTVPLRIAECFDALLERDPHQEALVTRSGRWTVVEFDDLCARAAQVWLDLGVTAGDRVAASLPNDVDILAAFHGAMRIGAIWVGVNQNLAPPEKAFLLEDSGSSFLLADEVTVDSLGGFRSDLPSLREPVTLEQWLAGMGAARAARDLPPVDPEAPAGLGYTSGTTGRPKGAVHSQRNLLLPGAVLSATRGYGPDLRKGDCFPLTILNMMALTILLTSAAGGTAVIMDQLHAQGVADWIERERVTVWNGPPALLHSLVAADDVAASALSSLREVWSGGSALPESLRERFFERFGVPVVGTYGLTEAPTVVSIDPPDGSFRPEASGQVLAHLEVRIESDDGVNVSEPGELCLVAATEGPWAGAFRPVLGYWERPEASAELLAGGVVHTGDVGLLDEGGWLRIVDRRNLVILRGGANVYPAEVERVLDSFEEVVACAVAGIPDERLGERVVAALELEDGVVLTEAALIERCRPLLARYKIPERFVFVEALPRNAMGKVDRNALAALVS